MSSSKFSSPFFKKSPLLGAYTSGADAVFAPSDAKHFSKLNNDLLGATMAAMNPKSSKCEEIRTRWHNDKMSDKAYADASKDCATDSDTETKPPIDYSDLDNKNSYYYDYNEG
jgi:hypothetical protein